MSADDTAFRAKVGDTPLGHLTTWRLHRAKRLLRDTPMSVQEVAAEIGYRTGPALSRTFLRREGAAPGAWRRMTSAPEPTRAATPEYTGADRGGHVVHTGGEHASSLQLPVQKETFR